MRGMTDDQKQLLMDAWIVRRGLVPVVALDESGRGYVVEATRELAEQRFATIYQSHRTEMDNRLHDRRLARHADKRRGGADA